METVDKLCYENRAQQLGHRYICGCDEVGRGPLAGPVVCASVILPLDDIIFGIDDSKKLSAKKRKTLSEIIKNKAISYKISFKSEKIVDEINILNATKRAMEECINGMDVKPDFALIDAVTGLDLVCDSQSIIGGDAKSYLIGAASILAKVARDEYMENIDSAYSQYGFAKHKGYGTKEHMEALRKYGPCEIHRKSFLKFLEK